MKLSHWAGSALLIALVAFMSLSAVQAQSGADIGYYLADDANGVQQVYQLLIDGQSEARQITGAESDVMSFGASYDGLAVAYISGGQLWLQPIHTDTADALAPISVKTYFASPVFSQDGQYIAYADDGVWLLDLGTRETRQLLADVPLQGNASNAGLYRLYRPVRFVPGADGSGAAKLIVDVGIWEWNSVGVVDLATGDLQELAGQFHTDLLPLADGRVLLFGNTGVAGDFALHLASSLDDINTTTEAVSFVSFTDRTLFAEQAVEVRPGIVRVFGSSIGTTTPDPVIFSFDYDLGNGTVSGLNFITLSTSTTGATIAGELSPNGAVVPVYFDAVWDDFGSLLGSFRLYNVLTDEVLSAPFPATVGMFHWQP